jgi:hypothetical protein
MPIDSFSTTSLERAVMQMTRPSRFLLDTFFPSEVFSQGRESISFEKVRARPRIAPYVHPDVAAKPFAASGRELVEITPPTVKMLTPIKPSMVLKRALGEQIGGGPLSAEQREAALTEQIIMEHLSAVTFREQQQAGELLCTGNVTVSGDGYDTAQVINFQRASALTIALAGNDRWSVNHVDSDPEGDIENVATSVAENDGGIMTDLVFGPDAWSFFKTRLIALSKFQPLFDYARASESRVEAGPQGGVGARFLGTLSGQYRCWWYYETFINAAGTRVPIVPRNAMLGVAAGGEGVGFDGMRGYGSIQDAELGYAALPYAVTEFIEKNPSRKNIMTQSTPLMMPGNPNSSACITVS